MASAEKEESDDNLYYQAYAAGVLFVTVSLTFNGCLFYTCYPGMSNFDSVHAGWSPTGGMFLGTFNETWQCEEACMASAKVCHSFTFLTHGTMKDRLNGQCYGALKSSWDPHAMSRKTGSTVSGVVSPFARLVGPAALTLSRNGVPLGRIVSTVLEIREAIHQWPLFAALSWHMYPTDEQAQKDLLFLTYAVLLTWPLLHQLLIDRQNYIKMLKEA